MRWFARWGRSKLGCIVPGEKSSIDCVSGELSRSCRMRCDEFEARLQGLLDRRGQFESDETLFAHADTCASCAARLAAYEAVLETLPLLGVPESSDDLTDRV